MNVGAAEAIKQHDYQAGDWFNSLSLFSIPFLWFMQVALFRLFTILDPS